MTPGQLGPVSSACLACLLAVGCGSDRLPTYEAGGRVAFPDGTPLRRGWVEFEMVDREPAVTARGEIQEDGTFELGTYQPGDGAVEGRHRAAVMVPLPEGAGDDPRLLRHAIDLRFNGFDTSGLEYTVGRGTSQNDFRVTVTPPSGG